jgi:hypothetical protein
MCRTGGRRCPSHSNPEAVANRNARRRASYSQKQNSVAPYKQHGFTAPDGKEKAAPISYDDQEAASIVELQNLSQEERNSVNMFTSSNFNWINGSLFGKEDVLYSAESEGADVEMMGDISMEDEPLELDYPTVDNVVTVVNTLDQAFMSAPAVERILYRGKGMSSSRFNGDTNAYVDKNYALGQEVVFDGYQSASLDPHVGNDYAGDSGIVFEMKTSSGLNAQSISDFSEEREILLPRQTRWKVVGVHKKAKYVTFSEEDQTQVEHKVTVVQMVEIDESGSALTERVAPAPLDRSKLVDSVIKSEFGF